MSIWHKRSDAKKDIMFIGEQFEREAGVVAVVAPGVLEDTTETKRCSELDVDVVGIVALAVLGDEIEDEDRRGAAA
eukprot:81157-Amphidinium_carterae.2